MAWTVPSDRSTGDTITSSIWNENIGASGNSALLKTSVNNSGAVEFVDATELTIASGVITVTANYHKVDTEGDASSDDLDTITAGTNVAAGFILHLRVEAAARTVVIKAGTGGADNLEIGTDVTLDEAYKTYSLVYDGANWRPLTLAPTFADVSPLTTRGDTLVATSGTVTGTRLAVGSANQLLKTDGTDVAWTTQIANAALPTNADLAGTLDVTSATTLDSTLAVADDAAFDTDTLFVDASEDKVGINTTAPLAPLHVFVSDVAAPPNANSFIVFEKNGSGNYLEFLAPNVVAEGGGLLFTSPSAQGSINYNANITTVQCGPNLSTSGALSKGSGAFKISHPLPAKANTHNLVHSFAESSETLLIYRSTVTLVAGQAEVDLDDAAGMSTGTFVCLCRDPSCFTSNESGWASVRGSVTGNILTIECEDATSTDTISWMVVANRQDANIKGANWTDAEGRPIIEPEKVEGE